jgi:hypothetical protein
MSANRSVQAAQRRRAGPPDGGMPGKGPQPSINSAQMFANQARPGQGPNIPSGRLAGQQAALQQQQQMQQQGQQKEGLSSVTKMSIPQAITLITLRLGMIETKLQHILEGDLNMSEGFQSTGIDPGVFESIMTRLDALENKPSNVSSGNLISSVSNSELGLLKQQFETLKQAVIQQKGTSTGLVKENVALKTQVENLRKELTETKELLAALQNLTMDNSQKILNLSMGITNEEDGGEELLDEQFILSSDGFTNLEDLENLEEDDDTMGTNLKSLIESELNIVGV